MGTSSTSYPSKWKTGKTRVVRVPEAIAGTLIAIAKKLDANSNQYIFREDQNILTLEFLPVKKVEYKLTKPVNVSSIPQRSPFRYPGGKTWLVPYIRAWLNSKKAKPTRLIEPFAGGAVVSLTAGFEQLSKHVVFAELDAGVASVWRVILNGQSDWLRERILNFDVTEKHVKQVLSSPANDLRQLAFQTILRNRVNRGGIMAPGAGLIKTGEADRGLKARWYPETLARRIREINQIKSRFSFIEGDGLKLIDEHKHDRDVVFYVDPPYTIAARRLYNKWEVDHEDLFRIMSTCKGDFLMSYDNTAEIAALAERFGFETKSIAMKSTHHAKMTEFLIGRDLSWVEKASS